MQIHVTEDIQELWSLAKVDFDLVDWELRIWGCKFEGLCDWDLKMIMVGECSSPKAQCYLMLHEIAHAIHAEKGHGVEWLNKFKMVLEKYGFEIEDHDTEQYPSKY
jgi:Zn-dependent peptidase ImmA (M78 family)